MSHVAVVGTAAVFLGTSPVGAQRVRFARLGPDDGLSQASVYAIAQDVDGFLWVGTGNGLDRYDGNTFRSLWIEGATSSPVSYGLVRALHSDAGGRLWAAVDDRGLFLYDRLRERFHHVRTFAANGDDHGPVARVWSFAETGDTLLLVATDEGIAHIAWDSAGAMLLLDGDRVGDCDRAVTALWSAPDAMWWGTQDGCILRGTTPFDTTVAIVARAGATIREIKPGIGDVVHVATQGRGVLLFHRDGRSWSDPPPKGRSSRLTEQVQAILTTEMGDTWIGTRGGLAWVQPDGVDTTWFSAGSAASGDLPNPIVQVLYEDRSGVLWVGTWSGLARLSPFYRGIRFIPERADRNGEPFGGVVSIVEDRDGGILTGSLGGALTRVRGSAAGPGTALARAPRLADVFSMARARGGGLWVGTYGSGIQRLGPGGWRSYRAGRAGAGEAPDDYVTAVFVDHAGTVWTGGRSSGLARYIPDTDRFEPFHAAPPGNGLSSSYVWPIREDTHGDLWFGKNGAEGGIFRLRADRRTLDFFGTTGVTNDRPNAGRVLTLLVSGDTMVWFGTQGGGLGRLDPRTGDIRFFTTANGLPHDNVEGLLEDRSGHLWVTTNGGLARFDPSTEDFWVFLLSSGIQDMRFFANSAYRSPEGLLYFGGPNGITVIDPERVVPRSTPPGLALIHFAVEGAEREDITNLSAREGVELGPDENFFTLEFAALDFTESSRNWFRYRLDDFEGSWVDAGTQRSARYTDVRPGRYTFRVEARNSDGVWSEGGLAVPILVRPPFYDTVWFRAAALSLLAGILWVVHLYRRRENERIRTMRLRIAGELHDDIGANLSAIALKSALVRRITDMEDRGTTALADIQGLANDTMQKVREMIWVVKEEHDSIQGLVTRMEDVVGTLLGGVVDFTFTVDPAMLDGQLDMAIRQDIYRVFKEAIQNVMKHAGAVSVTIRVEYAAPELRIVVMDDGCGFEERNVRRGTGLALMEVRDKRKDARVKVSSAPGHGTTVEIAVRVHPRMRGGHIA